MTVTMKNVDPQFFAVLKDIVKMRKGVEIMEGGGAENADKRNEAYSSKLETFRARYSDLLENPDEEIDNAFENLRDYGESLRASEEHVW